MGFEDLWGGDLLFLRSPSLTTGHLSLLSLLPALNCCPEKLLGVGKRKQANITKVNTLAGLKPEPLSESVLKAVLREGSLYGAVVVGSRGQRAGPWVGGSISIG